MELGVNENGSFSCKTRRQGLHRQVQQPQPPSDSAGSESQGRNREPQRDVPRRMVQQRQVKKTQKPNGRTSSQSHESNSECDIDDCYSDGENDGPYDGGEYDNEDNFIESDSCAMAHSEDSSYKSNDVISKTSTDSMSIQTINSSTESRVTGKRKQDTDNSSKEGNNSIGTKLLKVSNIVINTDYKTKYTCDVCDFSSNSAKALSDHYVSEKHLQLIDNNIEKIKFKCDFCKLRTKSRQDFVRHVLEIKKHGKRVRNSSDL